MGRLLPHARLIHKPRVPSAPPTLHPAAIALVRFICRSFRPLPPAGNDQIKCYDYQWHAGRLGSDELPRTRTATPHFNTPDATDGSAIRRNGGRSAHQSLAFCPTSFSGKLRGDIICVHPSRRASEACVFSCRRSPTLCRCAFVILRLHVQGAGVVGVYTLYLPTAGA